VKKRTTNSHRMLRVQNCCEPRKKRVYGSWKWKKKPTKAIISSEGVGGRTGAGNHRGKQARNDEEKTKDSGKKKLQCCRPHITSRTQFGHKFMSFKST